jgi:hypothetical protein
VQSAPSGHEIHSLAAETASVEVVLFSKGLL